VTYSYDAADRLTGLSNGSESLAYAYDAANRRTSLTLPNGLQAQYSYDAASQLLALSYMNGTTPIGTLSYAYDPVGNRIATTGSLASDLLPSATTGGTAVNAANRLTAANGYTPSYDAQGQMTQDGQGHSYVWDARHQLAQILSGTTPIASFQYDAFGRRTQKTVNGTTTAYLYDGSDPIQEQQGGTLNNLLTGPGTDERYARDDMTGRTYFLTDALGSTVALTDSSGNIQQQYSYDPYGSYTTSSSSSFTNPYTYTGREDDQTGLYYYRDRYYWPGHAFVSEDPIGLAGGPNAYLYGDDDPTSEIDPNGDCPWCIGAVIGAGIDLATQLAANGGNFHCVSWTQVGISAALGAVGGEFGGRGLTSGLRGLSNFTKRDIGEGLSILENRLSGASLVARNEATIPGGFTTEVDSTWNSFFGKRYYVESKFGKGSLTRAQRVAAAALPADIYRVERWGYPFFDRAGAYAGGTAGALAGNSGASGGNSGCGCQ
jgi:RHS repeat-associated protein